MCRVLDLYVVRRCIARYFLGKSDKDDRLHTKKRVLLAAIGDGRATDPLVISSATLTADLDKLWTSVHMNAVFSSSPTASTWSLIVAFLVISYEFKKKSVVGYKRRDVWTEGCKNTPATSLAG